MISIEEKLQFVQAQLTRAPRLRQTWDVYAAFIKEHFDDDTVKAVVRKRVEQIGH